jgi:hypothetical protein
MQDLRDDLAPTTREVVTLRENLTASEERMVSLYRRLQHTEEIHQELLTALSTGHIRDRRQASTLPCGHGDEDGGYVRVPPTPRLPPPPPRHGDPSTRDLSFKSSGSSTGGVSLALPSPYAPNSKYSSAPFASDQYLVPERFDRSLSLNPSSTRDTRPQPFGGPRVPPGTSQASALRLSSPRRSSGFSEVSTPRPRTARPPRPDTELQQTQQSNIAGSKNNASFLPMVVENILIERKRHVDKGSLKKW